MNPAPLTASTTTPGVVTSMAVTAPPEGGVVPKITCPATDPTPPAHDMRKPPLNVSEAVLVPASVAHDDPARLMLTVKSAGSTVSAGVNDALPLITQAPGVSANAGAGALTAASSPSAEQATMNAEMKIRTSLSRSAAANLADSQQLVRQVMPSSREQRMPNMPAASGPDSVARLRPSGRITIEDTMYVAGRPSLLL